jgi:hypothetical protein
MPFLQIVPIACACPQLPKKLKGVGIGSVWECPDCYRQWKLLQDPDPFSKEGAWKQLPENEWLPSPNRGDLFELDLLRQYEAALMSFGWQKGIPYEVKSGVATPV